VSTELIFFIVTAVVANIVALGVLLALPRNGRRQPATDSVAVRALESPPALREPDAKYAPPVAALTDSRSSSRVLRILWWITIAIVLVGVGATGAFPADQPLIYAIGAAAVLVVLLFHEAMPAAWRRPFTYGIEALLALALASGLMALTGYAQSPFFFTMIVIAVAVALARGGRPSFVVAALAGLAYLGVLAIDPGRDAFGGGELLRFGLNIGSIWLLAFLAAFFSGHERRLRSEMLQLSVTDPLTGLFNRAQIYTQLDQEIRRTRRSERGFCLLMVDLDGLKQVNDSFGHHRGDEVLVSLGLVIRRSIRAVDTAYRYGGDEFVVLLPETDIVGAYVVAEKIRTGTEDLAGAHGEGAQTSVSIGLVSHPEDGSTVDELMIAADRAMYAAKTLGKNQISGYPRPHRTPPPLPAPSRAPTPVGPGPDVEPSEVDLPPAAGAATVGSQEEAQAVRVDEPAIAERNGTPGSRPAESGSESDDFDPAEARRRIAALSYDPDHQIRRAMDAFLSAPPPRERREAGD
jgi:diguanylate cyclase (GGDEF)-like protein